LKQILRNTEFLSYRQVKLPFEKLLYALRNFPEEATDPDVLLPLAFSFKVIHFLFRRTCVYMSACFWINLLLHAFYYVFLLIFPSSQEQKVGTCCFLKPSPFLIFVFGLQGYPPTIVVRQ
jgi:hypothetical protein